MVTLTHSRLAALLLAPAFLLAACTDAAQDDAGASAPVNEEPDSAMTFDLQGHRGARGLVPENTQQSFRRALELGVTTLEMDVVITADSQVVVSHEPWMNEAICSLPGGEPVPEGAGRRYNIYQMPYGEVARYDCGARGNPRFPEQVAQPARKPLLDEVIAAAERYSAQNYPAEAPIRYNIETKSQPAGDDLFHPDPATFTRLLYDVVADAGVVERATIQSFDPRTLRVAREIDPDWPTVLLVEGGTELSFAEHIDRLGFRPNVYSPNFALVDDELIAAAAGEEIAVIPWTVNEKDDMERLIDLGVDGIITDYPDRLVDVLTERGIRWR
jgi:glycerophosphoryl diester phosphodiesterase